MQFCGILHAFQFKRPGHHGREAGQHRHERVHCFQRLNAEPFQAGAEESGRSAVAVSCDEPAGGKIVVPGLQSVDAGTF